MRRAGQDVHVVWWVEWGVLFDEESKIYIFVREQSTMVGKQSRIVGEQSKDGHGAEQDRSCLSLS